MKTKFFIAALVAMILSIGTMSAQKPTAEQMAQRMTDRMTEQLGLSREQSAQVHALHLEHVNTMRSHLVERNADQKSIAEHPEQEMDRAVDHVTRRMQEILTPDQFTKWQTMQPKGHKCPMMEDCKCKMCGKDGKMACGKEGHKNHKHHGAKMKEARHGKQKK